MQAAIDRYKRAHSDIRKFYEKATFQLNDTHPTVAVAELMRIPVSYTHLFLGTDGFPPLQGDACDGML